MDYYDFLRLKEEKQEIKELIFEHELKLYLIDCTSAVSGAVGIFEANNKPEFLIINEKS